MSQAWAVLLLVLFIVVSVLLIIVVLLQKGRGGGLGAAFGGAGSSAFGTRTGDVFTWVTIVLTALFLLLAVGSNLIVKPEKDRVVTPSFEPAQTSIGEPTPVSISCVHGKGVKPKIYYTTDGSNPVPNAGGTTEYQSVPVMVKPGTRLKALATATNMDDSEIATAYYAPLTATSIPVLPPEKTTKPAGKSTSEPAGKSTSEPSGKATSVPAGASTSSAPTPTPASVPAKPAATK